jgi:membrane protein
MSRTPIAPHVSKLRRLTIGEWLQVVWRYVRYLAARLLEDRCLQIAGSLTYTTLLALVPMFTVALTVVSIFPMFGDFVANFKVFILKNMVPDVSSRVIGVYMQQFAENAIRLKLIGLVIIAITAVALMFTIDEAFNTIWRAKRKQKWVKRTFTYLLLILTGPILIGISLSINAGILRAAHKLEGSLPLLDDTLMRLFPIVLTTAALFMAYRMVPRRYVPTRHALVGAAVAALAFEITKHGFVSYMTMFPSYSVVYGAFATIPIFLLWIFCCWLVVLLGAEIAATMSYFRSGRLHELAEFTYPAHRLRDAIAVLLSMAKYREEALNTGSNSGYAGQNFEQVRHRAPMPIDQAEDILHKLVDAGTVSFLNQRYRLIKTLDQIKFADLVEQFAWGSRVEASIEASVDVTNNPRLRDVLEGRKRDYADLSLQEFYRG